MCVAQVLAAQIWNLFVTTRHCVWSRKEGLCLPGWSSKNRSLSPGQGSWFLMCQLLPVGRAGEGLERGWGVSPININAFQLSGCFLKTAWSLEGCLTAVVLKLGPMCQDPLEGLWKPRWPGPLSNFCDSGCLRWGQRICIANKFPGAALETMLCRTGFPPQRKGSEGELARKCLALGEGMSSRKSTFTFFSFPSVSSPLFLLYFYFYF